MIHRITRHAAQRIWHDALSHEEGVRGLLFSAGDCIVGALRPWEPLQEARIRAALREPDWRICGIFDSVLPDAAEAIEREAMLEALPRAWVLPSLLHIHLDLRSAGLLKMAAYALLNDRLIPVTLQMETD